MNLTATGNITITRGTDADYSQPCRDSGLQCRQLRE
jgi:hypothetical protein